MSEHEDALEEQHHDGDENERAPDFVGKNAVKPVA
jgi:hypothetical protein